MRRPPTLRCALEIAGFVSLSALSSIPVPCVASAQPARAPVASAPASGGLAPTRSVAPPASPAQPRSFPEDRARAYLQRQASELKNPLSGLELRQVFPLGPPNARGLGPDGATVRFVRHHLGVPVLDDDVIVRLDARGQGLSFQARALTLPGDAQPRVTLEQARLFLRQSFRTRGSLPGRLVFFPLQQRDGKSPVEQQARLAWELVETAASIGAIPHLSYVDASTGALLERREDRVAEAPEAYAYLLNPYLEAEPSLVELGPTAQNGLDDVRSELLNCTDTGELVTVPDVSGKPWDVHVCTQTAAPLPVDGNYFFEPMPTPTDPARDEDGFAAPHTFYTVQQAYTRFAQLGLEQLISQPIEVTTNLRSPNALDPAALVDPTGALSPLNNAYFSPSRQLSETETSPAVLVFGQGQTSDFAYDADVIYHEFGHAAVNTLGGPQYVVLDEFGGSVESSALNEGLADYFSAIFQGDPVVGEYAGLRWAPDGGGIRSLLADARCPRDIIGQQHNDSQPFSTALWAIRTAQPPAEQALVDQAVYAALSQMNTSTDIVTASRTVLKELEARLDSSAAEAAKTTLTDKGLLTCSRLVPVEPAGLETPILSYTSVMGTASWQALRPVPGFIQLELEVPDGRQQVTVRLYQSEFKGVKLPDYGTTQAPRALSMSVRWERPMAYRYSSEASGLMITTTSDLSVGFTPTQGTPLESTSFTYPEYEASVVSDHRPGKLYLQFANADPESANLYDVRIAYTTLPDLPPSQEQEEPGGCGCQLAATRGPGWTELGWGGVVLAGWMRRRRQVWSGRQA